MTTLMLAWRDLMFERMYLICNVAAMVGILVPLLVLFGVKNGVYQHLIGNLLSNPATLQIDTVGNATFTEEDLSPIFDWPEVAFATAKTRSLFDNVNVVRAGARRLAPALLVPSGMGDPNLPAGVDLPTDQVVVSTLLAKALELSQGDQINLITQAEDRPKQLSVPVTVALILPPDRAAGRTIFARFEVLDLMEAFYESYALPDYGIEGARPLSDRTPSFEGMRIYARDLNELGALQARVEAQLGVQTQSRSRQVAAVLGLGRNLDLALLITVAIAALGLVATLVFGFWTTVLRKRHVLASIALIGVSSRQLALFPVVQAMVTATIGLITSFALYALAGAVAQRLFGSGLGEGARVAVITGAQAMLICAGVLCVVAIASLFAARAAQKMDPASVLRETV